MTFQNHINTAVRRIYKNKLYSAINIIGLSIGLYACLIIATVVVDDLSYDKDWSDANELYRINTINKMGDGLYDKFASSFTGLGNTLQKEYPEVKAVSEFAVIKNRFKLKDGEPNGIEAETLNADSTLWQMLDFKVAVGNPVKYVAGQNNLVITESFRKKYFADDNPVGRVIHNVPTYGDKPRSYLITGIVQDIPTNTHLHAEVIVVTEGRTEELSKKQYGSFSQYYILMAKGTDMKAFAAKINKWYASFVEVKEPYQFEFQSIKDIYLHSDFAVYQFVKGDYDNIFILSGVALLLLIIACVNFVNLSTARSIYRVRETGVRKVLGASRKHLVIQYLTEAALFFLIAAVLAGVSYLFSLNSVEAFIGHSFAKTFVSDGYLIVVAALIILVLSLFTGFYPAWIISSFKPAATLKNALYTGVFSGQNLVRKSLVVLQFVIAIAVTVALIVMQDQVQFMKQKNVGFAKENLISVGAISWDGKGEAFKNELLAQTVVHNVSFTTWTPTSGKGYMSREVKYSDDPTKKRTVWYINADVDFATTLGLELQDGRLLNKQFAADAMSQDSLFALAETDAEKYKATVNLQSSLITEHTAKILDVQKLNESLPEAQTTPVGIVRDFHKESLKSSLEPTIIIGENYPDYSRLLVRVEPGREKDAMLVLNKVWRKFYPEKFLDANWVNEQIENQYKAEAKLGSLFTFFSVLSLFLAALGVFGLIVQAAAQRIKEVGIRKVLGASVTNITAMLSKDFVKLVLIASAIAFPVAWWFMNEWLQGFAFRIGISWWVFAVAAFTALLITVVTVSTQALKAALSNPVKSLRTE